VFSRTSCISNSPLYFVEVWVWPGFFFLHKHKQKYSWFG
jgi:hypothetical protein